MAGYPAMLGGQIQRAMMGPRPLDPVPATFDAHCHLQALPRGEVAGALDRAHVAGVTRMVCCATTEADWEAVLALATEHSQILPMLGIHPWKVAEARSGWEVRLEALLIEHRAGIGECGLDFARRPLDRAAQASVFRRHLRLAATLHRPLAIHCVRAWGALKTILIEEGLPPAGAMVHAFGGSAETARELQDLGLLLSFSGRQLAPVASPGPTALAAVHDDHLLLESDSPSPSALEPAALPALAAAAAALRGCSAAHLAEITRRNAESLFEEILA